MQNRKYSKLFLTIAVVALLIVVAYSVGSLASEWKLNCCAYGEPCERNLNPERCDASLDFFKQIHTVIENTYEYSSISFHQHSFDIVKLSSDRIDSLVFNSNLNQETFTTLLESKNTYPELIFATNGGIFFPSYQPLGLYIENGKMLTTLNTSTGEGNFFLQPNGVLYIQNNKAHIIQTDEFIHSKEIEQAVQSGPMLVLNETIHPAFSKDSQSKYIRSGVGVNKQGDIFFAISNQPVTFYEFALFFKDKLQSTQALYLDGAISEMYIPTYREHSFQKFGTIIGIKKMAQ